MQCKQCGSLVDADARFCATCGSSIGAGSGSSQIDSKASASHAQVVIVKSGKSPGTAAVLSFLVCGLGQIYNGQIGKGIVLIVVYIMSALLMFAVIGFITTPILWIWGMVDAYHSAEKLNREAGLA